MMLASLALCAAAIGAGPGQLYVLVSDERPLRGIERAGAGLRLPMHVLDLSAVESVSARVDDALAFVDGLSEAEVLAREAEIERVATEAIGALRTDLVAAYRQAIVAGEIASRYGIDTLPAVIEIAADGRFRLSSEPVSLRAGLLEIDGQTHRPAPPPLGAERAARPGGDDARGRR